MEDQGYLTAAQTAQARTNPAQLSEAAEARAGGYFADWVMDTGPSYFTETTTEDVIIRTTLEQDIQSAAEEALAWVFENKGREGSEAQAAIVVMSADGAVRAMVGGRETKVAGVFNRATQALRQTGSLFKPFIYAAALELGHSPLELIVDEPLCLNVPGSGEWCPQNYDREFKGPITLTDALANSRNVPAVLLSEDVGREAVQTVARGFGMTGELADGPAIALGVTESTLVEMAGAYAGILNGGSSVVPYGLVELRLLGDDTSLMGSGGGIGERIIREESAQQLVWMMHQVVEAGSGMRARIDGWEIAGKSGTTQGARDAWFIGFTGDYVTAVWMGYDNNTPLTGVTGGGLPATIWHETMVRVLADKSPTPLPMIVPAPVEQPVTVNTGQQQGGGIIDNLLRDLLGGGQ
jgi:membrane peptidoglycan carboxypeptidase